jgi:uncharacterized membrane protein (DUF485 family)
MLIVGVRLYPEKAQIPLPTSSISSQLRFCLGIEERKVKPKNQRAKSRPGPCHKNPATWSQHFFRSFVYNLRPMPGRKQATHTTLEAVAAARWRMAVGLTVAMMVVYFGFILLIAFQKELLGISVIPGLTLGILLGALVIFTAWSLTWIYVRWANRHYDDSVAGLRR